MRTVTIELYRINELSVSARQLAVRNFRTAAPDCIYGDLSDDTVADFLEAYQVEYLRNGDAWDTSLEQI